MDTIGTTKARRRNWQPKEGDYTAINGATPLANVQNTSHAAQNSHDLYNGNIRYMQTSIINPLDRTKMPMLNAYKYDQLNRLKESRSYENGLSSNTWNPSNYGSEYYNAFTYDAMGNILTQERHNRAGQIFDDLEYKYQMDDDGNLLRNRLYSIKDDETLANVMEDDIEDMDPFISAINQINTHNNYSYDAEGRLVKDKQEEIDTIIWTVSGKVKEIRRSLSSNKKNLIFDYNAMGNRIAKHVYDNQTLMLEKSTYYILDAQGNQLSMYEHSVGDADVKYYLTERNIYGSSRLGTLKDPVNMFNAEPLQSYGILGNRNYELSNHLGNVLTVISDIKYPLSDDNTTITGYEVGISNIFDYSPFGAPLDGRTVEKEMYSSIEVCSDSVVIDTNYHISCDFQNGHCGWDAQNCLLSISYDLGTGEAKLRLPKCKKRIGFLPPYSYVPQDNMIYHSLETTDGTTYFYEFDFNIGSCINIDSIIFFEGENFNYIHHLTSSGHFTGSFTVATSGTSKVGFYLAGGTEDCFSTLDNFKIYTLDTNIIQNCVTELVASRYVYGYNTQEKVDEIAGAGNHYTAPYWEYDPRVVHRWNRDPKPVPSISPYAINQGNPIWFSDPYGDTIRIDENASPEFRAQVEKELEILKSTKRGAKMYNNLHSAEEDFIIKESQDRSYFQANQITVRSFSTGEESEKFEKGGTIFYKLGGANIPVQKNERSLLSKSEKSGKFSLFHELGHAEDYLDENNRKRWSEFGKDEIGERGLSEAEWSSTFKENQIRTELNSPLRLYYFTNRSGKGSFPALLKIDKIGVKSIWSEQSEYYFIKFND